MSNQSSNQATTPAISPPFDSPSHIIHNLNQNSYFRINDSDLRFTAQDLQAFQFSLLPPNQHASSNMGPPMHNLNNFSHLNNLNQYHPQYPASLGQHPLLNFAPGTVDPRHISSQSLEIPWNQASFPQLSQHGSVQSPFQRSVRPLPQTSHSARVPGSVHSYAPFDQGSRPPEHIASAASRSQSTSNSRVFKTESEDQSNDTSLQPESSGSLISKPRPGRALDKAASAPQSSRTKPRRLPIPRHVASKRPRLSEEEEPSEEEDSEDDDGPRTAGVKYHKACSNCRKQKGRCAKKESDDKCRMCKARNLTCVFEPRPERKQPVQRKFLLEQLRKKDAIIESFRQMLKPHMLHLDRKSVV